MFRPAQDIINCKQKYVSNQNHKSNIYKIEMKTKKNDEIG